MRRSHLWSALYMVVSKQALIEDGCQIRECLVRVTDDNVDDGGLVPYLKSSCMVSLSRMVLIRLACSPAVWFASVVIMEARVSAGLARRFGIGCRRSRGLQAWQGFPPS